MAIDMKRDMRRTLRQVYSREWIDNVLDRADVLSLAMSTQDGYPYVIPMRFGLENDVIYVHSSLKGQKAEMIKANPRVAFSAWVDVERYPRDGSPGRWHQKYRCVCGFGKAIAVTDDNEKLHAVNVIKSHYGESLANYKIDESVLKNLLGIYAIKIEHITGRVKGYENPDRPGARP